MGFCSSYWFGFLLASSWAPVLGVLKLLFLLAVGTYLRKLMEGWVSGTEAMKQVVCQPCTYLLGVSQPLGASSGGAMPRNLPCTWEPRLESPAPGFRLAQPWVLWEFRGWPRRGELFLSLPVSLLLLLTFKNYFPWRNEKIIFMGNISVIVGPSSYAFSVSSENCLTSVQPLLGILFSNAFLFLLFQLKCYLLWLFLLTFFWRDCWSFSM